MGCHPDWERVARERGLLDEKPVVPKSVHKFPFVILPLPPSSNNLYPTSKTGHRYKSKKYKEWIAAAKPIMENLKIPESFPVRYKYTIMCKMRITADGENRSKGILDLAKECGIIPDDNIQYIIGGSWEYAPDKEINGVMLEFIEVGK